MKKLLFNRLATEHWHRNLKGMVGLDVLLGPVIVLVGDKEFMKAQSS